MAGRSFLLIARSERQRATRQPSAQRELVRPKAEQSGDG